MRESLELLQGQLVGLKVDRELLREAEAALARGCLPHRLQLRSVGGIPLEGGGLHLAGPRLVPAAVGSKVVAVGQLLVVH